MNKLEKEQNSTEVLRWMSHTVQRITKRASQFLRTPTLTLSPKQGLLGVVALVSVLGLASAATLPEVQRGLDWLQNYVATTVTISGSGTSTGPTSKVATKAQTQCELAVTLNKFSGSNPQVQALVRDLAAGADTTNAANQASETLACLENLQNKLNLDTSASTLGNRKAPDGGFSAYQDGMISSPLDTGVALEAQFQKLSTTEIAKVLNFLQASQQTNGAFQTGNADQHLSTALIVRGLRKLSAQIPQAASMADKAATFLINAQAANGAWADDVALSALVYEAIFPYTGDKPQVTSTLKAYLLSKQSADGSWSADPYITAVALRALQLTTEEVPQNPTVPVDLTGTVSGQVTHGTTQAALANVDITVQSQPSSPGAAITLNVKTSSDGRYSIANVPAGAYTVQAVLAGFGTQSATFNLPAKGNLVYSPSLYVIEPSNPTGQPTDPRVSIQGRVIDSVTGNPIDQASMLVTSGSNSATFTSNATGAIAGQVNFSGQFNVTISKAGYADSVVTGLFPAGSAASLGDIRMVARPTSSSLRGVVLSTNGQPIAGASLKIVQTGTIVSSTAAGAYSFSGIPLKQFSVEVSASNFTTRTFALSSPDFGTLQADFVLNSVPSGPQSPPPPPTLSNLVVTPTTAASNTAIAATVTITNPATDAVAVETALNVISNDGTIISSLPYLSVTGAGWVDNKLQPGQSAQFSFQWNTGTFAAGNYRVETVLFKTGSRTAVNPLGVKLDSLGAAITVTPSPAFAGSARSNPPVVRAGVNATVTLSATLQNSGNVTLPSQSYVLRVIDTKTNTVKLMRDASAGVITLKGLAALAFGTWQDPPAGSYKLEVSSAGIPSSTVLGTLFVGDSTVAAFTVNQSAVPTGNSNVRGQIKVTGADVINGVSSDPLVPLIKEAVTKAVNFGDEYSYRHYVNDLRCYACHVQAQAIVGGERNLRFAPPVDPLKRSALMDQMTRHVQADGKLTYQDFFYPVVSTSVGLWGVTEWSKPQKIAQTTRHMADYLISKQLSSGRWDVDHQPTGIPSAWWVTNAPITALNAGSLLKLKKQYTSGITPTFPTQTELTLAGMPQGRTVVTPDRVGGFYAANFDANQLWYVPASGTPSMLVSGRNIANVVELDNGRLLMASWTQGVLLREANGQITTVNPTAVWDLLPYQGDFLATSAGYSPSNDQSIFRVKLDGTISTLYNTTLFDEYARGLALTPEGDILFNLFRKGETLRISPTGQLKDKPIPLGGTRALGLVNMPDGSYLKSVPRIGYEEVQGLYIYGSDFISERLMFGDVFHAAPLTDGRIIASQDNKLYEVRRVPVDVNAFIQRVDSTLDKAETWLMNGTEIVPLNNIDVAFRLMGLNEMRKRHAGTPREAQILAVMEPIGNTLWSRQRSDGGWMVSNDPVYGYGESDSMVTAMVGLALDSLNPSKDDPRYRKIIELLLSRQQGDGTWASENGISVIKQNPTTWVEIFLPTLLDRLGGIDTAVNVEFPANVVMSNPSLAPTSVTATTDGGQAVRWDLAGVTDAPRLLDFDLALNGMQVDETRPVAKSAALSFRNSFEPGTVTASINVPSVMANANTNVGVTADRAQYTEADIAVFAAQVTNAGGAARDVQVRFSVLDSAGNLVEVLALPAQTNVAAGATVPVQISWPVAGVLAGGYQIRAQLVSAQGIIYGSATTGFAVQPSAAQTNGARILTDRVAYSAAQTVQLTSRITNASANLVQNSLTAVTQVLNSSGQTVYTQSEAIPQLAPGAQRQYNYTVSAANLAAGNYQARVTLQDATGATLSTANTSFAVQASDQSGVGLTGQLQATPATALIGQGVALNLTLNNAGNAALTNLPVAIRVLNPDTGAVLSTYNQVVSTLAVSQTSNLQTSWTAIGADGQLVVAVATATVNGRDITLGQAQIRLQGVPALTLTPTSLDFGSTILLANGQLSPAVANQVITVRSTGTAPVTALTLALAGTDAAAYRIVTGAGAGTCTAGAALAINATCTIVVSYQPTQAKAHAAQVQVGHATSGTTPGTAPAVANLTGTAQAAVATISVTPTSLNFGSTTLGANGQLTPAVANQLVTVRATGNVPVQGLSFSLTGTDAAAFALPTGGTAGTCTAGMTLAPGASCTISVGYQPTQVKTHNAQLSVNHNAAGSAAQLVSLTGTATAPAVPAITVTPTSLNFGSTTLGANGQLTPAVANQVVTVRSTGNAPAQALSFSMGGTDATAFIVSGAGSTCTAGMTLAVGASCTLSVAYQPTQVKTHNAQLSVNITGTSGGNSTPQVVSLTGTAQAPAVPAITVTPSSLNFGSTAIGANGQLTPAVPSQLVTVSSTGNAPAQGLSFNLGGTDASAFTLPGGTCTAGMTLAPGASCTLAVGYQPTQAKTHNAQLSVNITGSTAKLVSLTGTATQTNTAALSLSSSLRAESRVLVFVACSSSEEDDDDHDKATSKASSKANNKAAKAKAGTLTQRSSDDDDDDDDDNNGSCTSAQRRGSAISSYLTSIGVVHKIVRDEASFIHEMRCGVYNAYWISGGAAKLSTQTVKELKEAVWRGEGLITDGVHDSRNQLMHDIHGVKQNGKLPQTGYSASVNATSLFAQGNWNTAGQPTKFDLQGGVSQVTFNASQGNQAPPPAVISNQYGNGHAMLFAFDLADMLRTSITSNTSALNTTWQDLLRVTTTYVGPRLPAGNASVTYSAGDIISLNLRVTNQSTSAQTVALQAAVPTGTTHHSASVAPATTSATQVNWTLNLAANASQDITWRIKVQDAVQLSNLILNLQAQTTTNGQNSTPVSSQTVVNISVPTVSSVTAAAISALNALQPTSNADKNNKTKAINAATTAQTKLQQGKPLEAIASWLEASDWLQGITTANLSASVSAARTALAWGLEVSQDAQCKALACLTGTITLSNATPALGSSLGVTRNVTNSCGATLSSLPVQTTLTNRNSLQSLLNNSTSVTLTNNQSNSATNTVSLSTSNSKSGDMLDAVLKADWQGHRIELANAQAQVLVPAACPAGGSVAIDRFTAITELERLEVRGGRPGAADWEWGLGRNTQTAGQFTQANLDWLSGINYTWTLTTTAAGQGTFTVKNGATTVAQGTYNNSGAPLRNGNAVRLSLKTATDSGTAQIAASITKVQGASVNHSLNLTSAGQAGTLVITHPGLSNGINLEGTARLTFTGSAPPQGSRLNMLVNAGQVVCP